MKKTLLAGTALAAAAMASIPAMAQDAVAPTVFTGSGLDFKISGFVGFVAGINLGDTNSDEFDRDYQFASDGRLQFDISNTTDSGLEYGARIRVDNVSTTSNFDVDRAYVFVKGSFGNVQLGDTASILGDVGYVFVPGDVCLAGGGACNIDGYYPSFGNFAFPVSLDPTYISGLDDSSGGVGGTRIKYYSPDFSGFQFGVEFTPAVNAPGGPSVSKYFNDGILYENEIGGSLQYSAEFDGGTTLRVAGTMAYADAAADPTFIQTGDGLFDEVGPADLFTYSLGAQVGFGGFGISFNWVGTSDSANTFTGVGNVENANTFAGGLTYAVGAATFGLGVAYTEADTFYIARAAGGALDGVRNLNEDWAVAGTILYNLAPGLNVYGELAYEYTSFEDREFTKAGGDKVNLPGGDQNGTVLLTGINVDF
jgi:predicted porin